MRQTDRTLRSTAVLAPLLSLRRAPERSSQRSASKSLCCRIFVLFRQKAKKKPNLSHCLLQAENRCENILPPTAPKKPARRRFQLPGRHGFATPQALAEEARSRQEIPSL